MNNLNYKINTVLIRDFHKHVSDVAYESVKDNFGGVLADKLCDLRHCVELTVPHVIKDLLDRPD
jgi:hypothetical protein